MSSQCFYSNAWSPLRNNESVGSGPGRQSKINVKAHIHCLQDTETLQGPDLEALDREDWCLSVSWQFAESGEQWVSSCLVAVSKRTKKEKKKKIPF